MSDEIRHFDDLHIQSAIDDALAELPSDKHIAVVATFDGKDVRGAVMAKIGGDWSFVGVLDKPLNGPWGGEVAVRWAK